MLKSIWKKEKRSAKHESAKPNTRKEQLESNFHVEKSKAKQQKPRVASLHQPMSLSPRLAFPCQTKLRVHQHHFVLS
jgi:hypothetical protein